MLTAHNIVCFAKDYDEDPTSNHHVMSMLAETNKVLWINSIGTRTPSLTSVRDLKKLLAKLVEFTKSFVGSGSAEPASELAVDLPDNLHIFTPIVLPFPHSKVAARINVWLMRRYIKRYQKRLDMDSFQLWSFIPSAEPYFGHMDESFSIYYCTDAYAEFSSVDGKRIAQQEEVLCKKVDLVLATANSLVEFHRPYSKNVALASHGVDHAHFSRALTVDSPQRPTALADIEGPILGFFGLIEDWIDLELLKDVATAKPDWNIVLIGRAVSDTSIMDDLPNVFLLGRLPYSELPEYCAYFDVGLIPFKINQLTKHVNPIKLREYFSAGMPVVSTSLPEVMFYSDQCVIADDPKGFIEGCESYLVEDSPSGRQQRSDLMLAETWHARIDAMGNTIEKLYLEKRETENR